MNDDPAHADLPPHGLTDGDGGLPPGPAAAVGHALATGDRTAVLATIHDEPIVVPYLVREDGTPQVRVFPGEALHALGTVEDPGGFRGIGIEMNLPDHGAIIELDEPEQRERQIREMALRRATS